MTSPQRLYLDHAATTPVLPEARAAVADALETWANPSSPHADGRRAHAALEAARRTIANALDWRHDVILTSGATEAIALAATRTKVPGRAYAATEHDAVGAAMGRAKVIGVGAGGLVDMAALDASLAGDPALVAVQHVNNETGVVQPVAEIADRVRGAGSLLLVDCAQSAGKLPLPDADFISISGHKFGGPPGCGALLVRDIAVLRASGGQERGYRRGTENLPAAAGMAAALAGRAFAEASPRIAELRRKLEAELIAVGRNRHRRGERAEPLHRRLCNAGRRQRQPARAARPRGDFGVGGQRLFVREHEAQPGARRDGRRARDVELRRQGKLRTGNQRRGHRPVRHRMAADCRALIGPRRMIYLDYQATTPVAPEVAEAMAPWIADKFANPHSPSRWGHEAAAAVEVARGQVERAIGLTGGSLAFCGSATEALNWALKGTMEKARGPPQPHRHRRAASMQQCSIAVSGWPGRGWI